MSIVSLPAHLHAGFEEHGPAPRHCLRCAQLNVQCDGQSSCSQCRGTRLPSQTTRKHLRVHNEKAALPHRSRSARAPLRTSQTSSNREVPPVSRVGRTDARFSSLLLPMDEYVTPSLAAKAASAQQIQLYTNFVISAYPCYFKAAMNRLPVNWVEHISSQCGGRADSPFDWAVRSMTTMYTGSLHNDPRYLDASRGLYLRALRGLSGLLSHMSTAKLDETMATAVVLAVYEMHSCTTTEGWIHHTCGIQALTRLRGAGAHVDGLGRAMFIASRNTFVTSALVTGEACFLEEPEWQALNEQIAAENAKKPDSSVYTDITERAFRAIVKLPGYVKRVRDLQRTAPNAEKKKRSMLLYEVLAVRAALRGIHTEFSVSVSTRRADHAQQTGFIGPIPHHFFDRFASLSIKGIRSGIMLLNYLIILLDPRQRSAAEMENHLIADQVQTDEYSCSAASLLTPLWPSGGPRLMIKSIIGPETREPPTSDWMDRMATTMGMEGVRVNLVDDG